MANMSYCRFENTLNDLYDCIDNISQEAENERDERKRKEMIHFLFENIIVRTGINLHAYMKMNNKIFCCIK